MPARNMLNAYNWKEPLVSFSTLHQCLGRNESGAEEIWSGPARTWRRRHFGVSDTSEHRLDKTDMNFRSSEQRKSNGGRRVSVLRTHLWTITITHKCDVCDRLWFLRNLKPVKPKHTLMLHKGGHTRCGISVKFTYTGVVHTHTAVNRRGFQFIIDTGRRTGGDRR